MKVVLFCGGLGMRLRDYSETIPKPMVCDRLSACAVVRNEVLRALRSQGFHSLPWASRRCNQELFPTSMTMGFERLRFVERR